MTDQTVNIPLLRKAVEWAETEAAKPERLREWRQAYWVTPTSADAAAAWGVWAATSTTEELGKDAECGTCYCIAGYVVASQFGPGRFDDQTLPEVAGDLLGITDSQRGELFRAYNGIEDVRRIAEDIAGERL